eukprot:4733107-Alexandrium_andersonii.AAC.1
MPPTYWPVPGVILLPFAILAPTMCRTQYWGNPNTYSTWEDESLDAVLASVGSQAHVGATWASRCVAFFAKAADSCTRKR